MVRIRFRDEDGGTQEIAAETGISLMENAKRHGIGGIEAECGGSMVCGTCQVYVPEPWFSTIPPASGMEAEMVEYTRHPRPTSRLSCQILVTEAMEGMEVGLPHSQR